MTVRRGSAKRPTAAGAGVEATNALPLSERRAPRRPKPVSDVLAVASPEADIRLGVPARKEIVRTIAALHHQRNQEPR